MTASAVPRGRRVLLARANWKVRDMSPETAPAATGRPRSFLGLLLRRAWLVVLAAVLAGVAVFAVSRSLPTEYTAHGQVFLGPDAYVTPSSQNRPEQRVNTLVELAASELALARVSERVDVPVEDLRDQLSSSPGEAADVIELEATAPTADEAEALVTAQGEVLRELLEEGPAPAPEEVTGPPVAYFSVAAPDEPSSPRPTRDAVLGALLGALLAVSLVWLRWLRTANAPEDAGGSRAWRQRVAALTRRSTSRPRRPDGARPRRRFHLPPRWTGSRRGGPPAPAHRAGPTAAPPTAAPPAGATRVDGGAAGGYTPAPPPAPPGPGGRHGGAGSSAQRHGTGRGSSRGTS